MPSVAWQEWNTTRAAGCRHVSICALTATRPMTPSPRAVAREALRLAPEALPACSCKFSRPDFTQNPLFALLARKTFFRTDSRGLLRRGEDFAALRRDL